MARELSADELQSLLGPYALDAVTEDERAQVERYLERSPRARTEVAQLRETAAFLAHAGADAPPGLWDRIAGALGDDTPDTADAPRRLVALPGPSPTPALAASTGRWKRRVAAAVAAVAATIVISVLAVQVVHQDDRIDDLEAGDEDGVLAAAEAAQRNPDARATTLQSADGSVSAEVVYLPDGSGFLVEDNLAPLMPHRTYQLWAMVGEGESPRPISAAVLGPDPGVTAFRIDEPVVAFRVTDEAAPGVTSPEGSLVVEGEVPPA